MTWGAYGAWGTGAAAWGTGTVLPPPTIITATPAIVARRGGTTVTLVGTNFFDPMTIEILSGTFPAYTVEGTGYYFDPAYDLRENKVYFGTPALPDGIYHIRATTSGGTAVGIGLLDYRLFAEEHKALGVRGKFARVWDTGPRILSGGV